MALSKQKSFTTKYNKPRRKIKFTTLSLLFAGSMSGVFAATTGTFNQTDWSGGPSTNNAAHPSDQSTWNQYSNQDTGIATINGGADLSLATQIFSTTLTTDTDFALAQTTKQTLSTQSDFSAALVQNNILVTQQGSIILQPSTPIPVSWTYTNSLNIPDSGANFAPELVDLDGDGDLDVLMGTGSKYYALCYLNKTTTNTPVWVRTTACDTPYLSGAAFYRVTAGDLDGDGDPDLIIGASAGWLKAVENIGSIAFPIWQLNADWDGPNVSTYTNPELADIDNDGDQDLYVGAEDGYTYVFENIAPDSTAPVWGGEPTGWEPGIDAGSYAAPSLGDLDGDGDLDLFASGGTTFAAYRNDGTPSSPTWVVADASWTANVTYTLYQVPEIGDLDNDGDADLMNGAIGGGGLTHLNTGATYPSAGNYESKIIDIGNHDGLVSLSYDTSAPALTSIAIDIGAGNTATPDGSWTWLTGVASGVDISSFGQSRYLQYRVSLQTTDPLATSALHEITIDYINYTATEADGSNLFIEKEGANASIGLSYDWSPSSLSSYDVFAYGTKYVTYKDGFMFFTEDGGQRGYHNVVNVSTLSAPFSTSRIDVGRRSQSNLVIEGNLSIMGTASGLHIFDITTASTPSTTSALTSLGWTVHTEISGDFAYLAMWQNGTTIVDISDPANPVSESIFPSTRESRSSKYNNGYLYVIETNSSDILSNNLVILDVSNPKLAVDVGRLTTGGIANQMAMKDSYLYVATSVGLQIYNITDPSTPVFVSTNLDIIGAGQITIKKDLMYIALGTSGIDVIDIANPAQPKLLYTHANGSNYTGVDINNNIAYTTTSGAGIEILSLGPYANSGEYFSKIIDIGTHLGFTTVDFNRSVPTNTSLDLYVRSGNNLAIDATWTSWQLILNSGDSITALGTKRYFQFRSVMSSADVLASPLLDSITINYSRYAASGELISSPFDTTDANGLLDQTHWTESLPTGTAVQLQIRSAADNTGQLGNWSPWSGPDGTNASFWDSTNTHAGACTTTSATACIGLPSALRDAADEQWLQYKLTLLANPADTNLSPIVSAAGFSYASVNLSSPGSVNISNLSGPTTEAGGSASFNISLGSLPSSDVTITFQSSDLTEATVSPAFFTFNSGNWNSPIPVTYTGINDDIDDGDTSYNALISATSSSDANYDDLSPTVLTNNNIDDDTAGITLFPQAGLVTDEAGGTDTFTVVLNSEPLDDVSIDLFSSDIGEGIVSILDNDFLSTATFTFTPQNWNLPQTLKVTGIDDVIIDVNEPYSIITDPAISPGDSVYNGMDALDAQVNNTDDEIAAVVVDSMWGYNTSEQGGFLPITFKLTSKPTAAVTLMLSSSDTSEGTVSPSSIIIEPDKWDFAHAVTVKGWNDFLNDGDMPYTIITAALISADGDYNGLNPADISFINLDNEGTATAAVQITPTTGLVTTEAGGTDKFYLKLDKQPISAVTINFSVSPASEGFVSPSSLTFNPGDFLGPVQVAVTGLDDRIFDEADQPYTIVTTMVTSDPDYALIDPVDISVTNIDTSYTPQRLDIDKNEHYLGIDVTAADVNCDTIPDLIVGAVDGAFGEVYVYYGSASGYTDSPDWYARDDVSSTSFGRSLQGIGDINNDGCDDLAIGAYSRANFTGAVYVFHGSPQGLPDALNDGLARTSDANWTFYSDKSGSYTGQTIAAGDFDGNGFIDLAINATRYIVDQTAEGAVFVLMNSASGLPDAGGNGIAYPSDANWVFESDVSYSLPGDNKGLVAININGDAYDDLAIGARSFANGQSNEGRVWVFHGSASGLSDDLADGRAHADEADWIAENDTASSFFGHALANAGDLDSDGSDDLLVGASIYGNNDGAAYLFNGSVPGGLISASNGDGIVRANTEASWWVTAPNTFNYFGYNLGAAGDINNDTLPDIMIGDYRSDSCFRGAIYIYHNTGSSFSSSPDKVLNSPACGDNFGMRFGTLGDLNGDGYADVYVGAQANEDPTTEQNEGAVFIFITKAPTPGVTVTPSSGLRTTEQGGSATFDVVLNAPPSADVTLSVSISPADQTEGLISSDPVLTFNSENWRTPQTVMISGQNDAISDGDTLYTVDLAALVSSDNNYNGIDPINVSITNTDDDVFPEIEVFASSPVNENSGTQYIAFTRDNDVSSPLTINYSVGGSAMAGTDYDASTLTGSITIPIGDTAANIAINIVDDFIYEADKTIIVTTTTDAAYTLGTSATATMTIVDNDPIAITITPSFTLVTTETGGSATFSVSLGSQPQANVTLNMLSSRTDEGIISTAQLIFTPSDWAAKTVTVIGVDDGLDDGDVAYVIVTEAAISPGDANYNGVDPANVAVVNRDDDATRPTVTVATTVATINEGSNDIGIFSFNRTAPLTDALSVFFSLTGKAIANVDYASPGTSATFLAGNATTTVHIQSTQDSIVEGNETIVLTLVADSFYVIDTPNADTLTIIDDDDIAAPPRVNFHPDQVAIEGTTVTVQVALSETALNYPVTLPFSISGTANNPSDHNAVDGVISITSGTLGSTSFDLVDDGAGDADETLIFSLGTPTNAILGTKTTHTVTISEINLPPAVALNASQDGSETRLIIRSGSTVTISANVNDTNVADSHSFDWSTTNNNLTNIDDADDTTHVFDASGLTDGFYKIRLDVTDSGTPAITVRSELLLEIITTAPILTSIDSDNDGIADELESAQDTDGDGMADYLDANNLLTHELQLFAAQANTYIMRTEAGLALQLGDVAFAANADGAYVTVEDIANYGGGEGNAGSATTTGAAPNTGGYFDFKVTGLTAPGQSVKIVIPQTDSLPSNAVYQKYHPLSGWLDFVENSDNNLASAAGEPGLCPPPGSDSYTPGLNAGDLCIQMTIQDGGANDMDGETNYIIVDPAQVGGRIEATNPASNAPPQTPEKSTSGGGFIQLWSVVLLLLIRLRRWRSERHLPR